MALYTYMYDLSLFSTDRWTMGWRGAIGASLCVTESPDALHDLLGCCPVALQPPATALPQSHYADGGGERLPAELVTLLLQLLARLVGSPPGVGAVTAVWRTLLLLHPARLLFVCQTRY